jgi:organizing structure protein 2
LQSVIDRWIGVEHRIEGASLNLKQPFKYSLLICDTPYTSITSTNLSSVIIARLKSLAPPPETEPIFPGLLFVGISTLFGSILARPRSVPVRILAPPTFAFTAMLYFLPNTSHNVGDYLWHVEKRYVPGVEKRQSALVGHMGGMWRDAIAGVNEAKGGVGRGVDNALGWVQDNTGLKVKDAVQEGKKRSE